jgi:hypothetical protein
MSTPSSQKPLMPPTPLSLASDDGSDDDDHHGNQCCNIFLDFTSILLSVTEIGLVLYLSISHFSHSQGVIALAMLGPIFLNFVGVTYFLSKYVYLGIF